MQPKFLSPHCSQFASVVELTICFPFTLLLIVVPGLSWGELFHLHSETIHCGGVNSTRSSRAGWDFNLNLASQGSTCSWWLDQGWEWGQSHARSQVQIELILELLPEQPERKQASSSGLYLGGCESEAARETERAHLLGNEATQRKADTRDRGSCKAGIIIGLPLLNAIRIKWVCNIRYLNGAWHMGSTQ